MGQTESGCCVTRHRGVDDALVGPHFGHRPSRPRPSPEDAWSTDGCTGGTTANAHGFEEDQKQHRLGCLIPECVSERSHARAVLFNEKSLRPKLLMLRGLHTEEQALRHLVKSLGQECDVSLKRVPKGMLHGWVEEISVTDVAQRMLQFEKHMQDLPMAFLTGALILFFGSTSQLIPVKTFEVRYGEFLAVVVKLAQERLSTVAGEINEVKLETRNLEEQILDCFNKMDVEGTGQVTQERFVSFICGNSSDQCAASAEVVPADAANLFRDMAHGQHVLHYEQFKDSITNGCLDVMIGNIELRRLLQKRYRDCWL